MHFLKFSKAASTIGLSLMTAMIALASISSLTIFGQGSECQFDDLNTITDEVLGTSSAGSCGLAGTVNEETGSGGPFSSTLVYLSGPGEFGAGDSLGFRLDFSFPVFVSGNPTLNLKIGDHNVSVSAGSQTATSISFSHVLTDEDIGAIEVVNVDECEAQEQGDGNGNGSPEEEGSCNANTDDANDDVGDINIPNGATGIPNGGTAFIPGEGVAEEGKNYIAIGDNRWLYIDGDEFESRRTHDLIITNINYQPIEKITVTSNGRFSQMRVISANQNQIFGQYISGGSYDYWTMNVDDPIATFRTTLFPGTSGNDRRFYYADPLANGNFYGRLGEFFVEITPELQIVSAAKGSGTVRVLDGETLIKQTTNGLFIFESSLLEQATGTVKLPHFVGAAVHGKQEGIEENVLFMFDATNGILQKSRNHIGEKQVLIELNKPAGSGEVFFFFLNDSLSEHVNIFGRISRPDKCESCADPFMLVFDQNLSLVEGLLFESQTTNNGSNSVSAEASINGPMIFIQWRDRITMTQTGKEHEPTPLEHPTRIYMAMDSWTGIDPDSIPGISGIKVSNLTANLTEAPLNLHQSFGISSDFLEMFDFSFLNKDYSNQGYSVSNISF